MKHLHNLLGIVCGFALMIALLITSVEAVTYWTPGYYEREYTKYNVLDDVNMEMDDLLDVTDEMMAYLRGNREDLHVPTIVDGQPREFFNAREIAHMEDVRGLFLAGLALRRICLVTIAACCLLLVLLKADIKRVLPKMICVGTVLFFAAVAILTLIISTDFTKYFIIFHEIFFNNDLWMLDPSTDLLINIVPEPFFVDTAARIALTFAASVAATFAICLIWLKRIGRRCLTCLLCVTLLTAICPQRAMAAPAWPDDISIQAEGGIVMDAASGAVLYGKNIHVPYFPASITKILTALVVLENADMDEMVTFSHDAVFNVEAGSSSAGLDVGDQLCVRDCLYAMMLKSANEAANALAEHVAGSIEAFAGMMNEKAASLGCADSHFNNPSGLNDPNHYTSAYDMALIAQAAFQNEDFVEIDSTLYYDLPPSKWNPEGLRIYPGHKMMKKNTSLYYPGIIGGKTGYTSLAGNTLVTCAERDGMKLIAVVLNGHQTQYTDTKALLDFGYSNFRSLNVAEYDDTYTSVKNDMSIAGLPTTNLSILRVKDDCRITLPMQADVSDAVSSITYDLPEQAPEQAIAQISYHYNDRAIGTTYLMRNEKAADETAPVAEVTAASEVPETEPAEVPDTAGQPAPAADESNSGFRLQIPSGFWIVLGIFAGIAALIGGLFLLKMQIEKREESERMTRYQRRQKRLQDIGISSAEFDLLMQKKRSGSHRSAQKKKRRPKR